MFMKLWFIHTYLDLSLLPACLHLLICAPMAESVAIISSIFLLVILLIFVMVEKSLVFNNTADRAFVLHVAYLDLILGIPYGSPSPLGVIPESRTRSNS